MDSVELVLAMLLAVVASGYVVRMLPFPLPLPLVQIALGAVIEGVFGHGVTLEPDIFFLLFLPPLLFLDGWRIPKVGLFRDKSTILELALGLVVFTVIGAGYLIHWLVPSMPLAVAFALAAIVAPTDPIAVSSIASRVPIPPRLMHILEGEALLNDASGLVCFRFAVAAAITGHFSLASAAVTFLWVALAGIASGVAITLAISYAQRSLSRRFGEESGSPVLINLLTPFGAYLVAERLQGSGILAAVAAGITMSYVELSGRALATTRVRRAVVWDSVQFAFNGIVFVLLGEQLPDIISGALRAAEASGGERGLWRLASTALAVSLGLLLLRFIWVWVSLRLTLLSAKRQGHHVNVSKFRLVLATSLAGVRGALTMAGILTLPLTLANGRPLPGRHLAIFLAASVILISLVLASVALPPLLRSLKLPEEPADAAEEDFARHEAAVAAIAAVEQSSHQQAHQHIDPEIHSSAADHVMGIYEHRLAGGVAGSMDPAKVRMADQSERAFRLVALHAERDTILQLARDERISDETARKLLREIDLVEARYR
ncbi:Na+/H+ antiporter [Massilia solisilvae]|uniref:Na+/H+ antiporter n=1 Tax=Massilia solisilvae TaxID=1811225 RepID=A0ABT2BGU4_9BURK|nr:Na+/H+ antiporter [Massilia solisilvae]MCS0607734.1 Na+/H+ antiporter [Massilia solisilvae]